MAIEHEREWSGRYKLIRRVNWKLISDVNWFYFHIRINACLFSFHVDSDEFGILAVVNNYTGRFPKQVQFNLDFHFFFRRQRRTTFY